MTSLLEMYGMSGANNGPQGQDMRLLDLMRQAVGSDPSLFKSQALDPSTAALFGDVPNYGFGPMTQQSIAGQTGQGASLRPYEGSAGEEMFAAIAPYLPEGIKDRVRPAVMGLFDYGSMPAKSVVSQAETAGQSVYDATQDPSLANVTNAGVQSGLAVAPFFPAAGMAVAAGTGGVGLLEGARRDFAPDIMGAASANGADADPLDPGSRKRLTDLQKKQSTGKTLSRAEREEQNSYLGAIQSAATAKATAEAEARKTASQSERAEYDRRVLAAEAARNDALQRDYRFGDSEVGQVMKKVGPAAPLVAGAGAGALAGLASRAAGPISKYAGPGLGAFLGFDLAHAPVAGDAFFAPASNPQKEAYDAYARELPDTHPEKEKWISYAEGLPSQNPVRDEASKEFFDPLKFVERSAVGLAMGATGGKLGDIATRVPSGVAEGLAATPGRLASAYRTSQLGGELTDAEFAAIVAAKQRAGMMAAKPPKVTIPQPNLPQGAGPAAPAGGGVRPVAGQGGGQLVPPQGPQRPRALPQNNQSLSPAKKDEVLRRVASGDDLSSMSPLEQQYAQYLNDLSTKLGVAPQALLNARGARGNRSPWAAAGAVPMMGLIEDGDQ